MSVKAFFEAISNFDSSAIYDIDATNKFRKSVKLCYSRNLDLGLLKDVIYTLAQGKSLDEKHRQHSLKDFHPMPNAKALKCQECHIQPDWLLVWVQDDTKLLLLFANTGTHSDLF